MSGGAQAVHAMCMALHAGLMFFLMAVQAGGGCPLRQACPPRTGEEPCSVHA